MKNLRNGNYPGRVLKPTDPCAREWASPCRIRGSGRAPGSQGGLGAGELPGFCMCQLCRRGAAWGPELCLWIRFPRGDSRANPNPLARVRGLKEQVPVLGGGATCLGVRRAVTEEQEESRGESCGAERRSGTPGADAYVAGRHGQVGRSGGLAACADGCLADGRLNPHGIGLACDPGVPSSQAWLLPTVAESCDGRSSPSAVTSREGPPSTPLKTKCTLWATKVSARLRGLHKLGKIPSILRN